MKEILFIVIKISQVPEMIMDEAVEELGSLHSSIFDEFKNMKSYK